MSLDTDFLEGVVVVYPRFPVRQAHCERCKLHIRISSPTGYCPNCLCFYEVEDAECPDATLIAWHLNPPGN